MAGLAVREWGDPADPGILLWPGLGSTGAYFAQVAPALPGRTVAVDPPGFGRSPPLDVYTFERLTDLAAAVAHGCGCWAVVGHSLGAYLAVGVAAEPPPALRAAVLIDGGFMDATAMAEAGMPVSSGREQLIAWMRANAPLFADWETAFGQLAMMIGGEPTAAFEAYVREVFVEAGGEIRERTPPGEMADQVLAIVDRDVLSPAKRVQVPTLLIASGQPADRRPARERAWRQFAGSSSLIELQIVEAWGHNPALQDSEACARMIVDWLERQR